MIGHSFSSDCYSRYVAKINENVADKVSENVLHLEGKLQSLEQRRDLQLLKLMYHQSKNDENIKVAKRHTRATEKIVFNIPTRCTPKYLNSSYYLGSQMWNNLNEATQRMEDIKKFEKSVASLYKTYRVPKV